MTRPAPDSATLDRLAGVVGERYALRSGDEMAPYLVEQRNRYFGKAAMVLRPGSTEEVSQLLKIADETGTAIVPQGGNTGLVGAQTPFEHGGEVVLSLGRMNRIRSLDPLDNTITVDAGCILATIQTAADEVDRLFPLSLGSEGSCQIGGNLSSNAGGIGVLAYGNARALVLGLEVVLADGRIWNGLRALRKDNTGYDLRDLFVGAEGTLGVITGAVLKLFPKPRDTATAFIAVPSPAAAVELLSLASGISGNRVTGFEIMPRFGLDIVLRHGEGSRDPIAGEHPWYVLMDLSGGEAEGVLRAPSEAILETGFEKGLVLDATIAESKAQADALWYLRFALSELQKFEGGSIKHDVSVPVSRMPEFIEQGCAAAVALIPGSRPLPFGHIGDGNVHFNISQPVGADTKEFLSRWEEMNDAIHDLVLAHHGSVSAEHGIGRMKSHMMTAIKSPVELEMMRSIKHLFDPKNILNPGKMLPPDGGRS